MTTSLIWSSWGDCKTSKVEELWNPLTKEYVKARSRKTATELLILTALASAKAPISHAEISLEILNRYRGKVVRLPYSIKKELELYDEKGIVAEVGKTELQYVITEKGRHKLTELWGSCLT